MMHEILLELRIRNFYDVSYRKAEYRVPAPSFSFGAGGWMASAWQWNGEGTLVGEETRRGRKTAPGITKRKHSDRSLDLLRGACNGCGSIARDPHSSVTGGAQPFPIHTFTAAARSFRSGRETNA